MRFFIVSLFVSGTLLSACKVNQITASQPSESEMQEATSDSIAYDSMPEKSAATAALPYQPSETRLHDLLHTRLEVQFDWEKHYLLGKATLQLEPYFYPQSTLLLDAKGFDIHSVSLLEEEQLSPLTYAYDSASLQIDLGKTFTRGQSYWIVIDYTAKPDEFEAGGSEAITSDKGLYFIDGEDGQSPQMWTQGETEANSRWFPTIDSPNERSTQEMYITVDSRFVTLSNGTLIYSQVNEESSQSGSSQNGKMRTDYWKMDQPHAPYLFMMAVGEFAVIEDSWGDIPVNYYVDSAYAPYAQDIFGHTPAMINFFSEKIGVQYPWPKYSQVVVDEFVSGAMENTTASVFYDALEVDDRELLDNSWDGIIAHELFHHWFGDLVTCESWSNLPLNESFATYAEYLWSEHFYGPQEAEYVHWEQVQNYLSEAEEKEVDLIRFHYASQEDMFDRHSYDKGSCVLHMLRNYVGDEAFFTALKNYLGKHAYTSVEIHDLRMAFEEVVGQDLNWFFNQWFLSSGHPVLDVTSDYADGQLRLAIHQKQDLEKFTLYQLPVSVDVWVNDVKSRHELWVDEQDQEFTINLSGDPQLVVFDGDAALLAEVSHEKSEAEWAYQFRHTDSFIHQFTSLQALVNDSTATVTPQILEEALQNDFWVIRKLAINAQEGEIRSQDTVTLAQLEMIAKDDEKSLVRADAITALAAADPEKYWGLFLASMQDSSYSVVGTAIAAYAQTGASDKTAVFSAYRAYNNFNTVMALADYYVANAIPDQYEWFKARASAVSDETLYYLLNYMAQYLAVMDDEPLTRGVALLADYARNHSKYYIRLTAYRGLLFFSEDPEVSALLKSIVAAEKDEKLIELYQSNPY